MRTFLDHLVELNFQNKTVALIENGSWAPNAAKVMREILARARNISILEGQITLLSAMKEDTKNQLEKLACELMKPSEFLAKEKEAKKVVKKHHFACRICGFVLETELDELPSGYTCPICRHPASDFEKID